MAPSVRDGFARLAEARRTLVRQHPSSSIARFFGTDRTGHSFRATPYAWLSLIETQATAGLRDLLAAHDPEVRRERLRAFAIGVGLRDVAHLADLDGVATCEQSVRVRGRDRRLDLLVDLRAGSSRFSVLIEAKLGHSLTERQLRDYAAAVNRTVEGRPAAMIVLAPHRTANLSRELAGSPGWRFLSWSSLIRRIERALPEGADDEDFRRFRRTLWDRAA